MPQSSNGPRATARIRFQKATVEKLKRELGRLDSRTRSCYVTRFLREFRRAEGICPFSEALDEAAHADVIYLADYHALPASQAFAVRFVNQLLERRSQAREVVLCLEAFYARHQRLLDLYLSRQLSETEFLHRVHYEAEWGYEWKSYRSLLELARQRGLAVFGIDCEPRHDLRLIARRDHAAAEKIVRLARERRGAQCIVLFGESHLATDHLPGKVRRGASAHGMALREVVIAQNVDPLYWRHATEIADHTQAVRVSSGKYCVFTATPLEKYQAYARVIERWQAAGDLDEGEHAAAFYHTLDALLAFLKINKYSHRLKRAAGQLLVDVLPEIYDDRDFTAFVAILRRYDASLEEIHAVRRRARATGCAYAPRINAMFVESFNAVSVGEEAARFLASALRGEIWEQARFDYPSALDRFAALALDEALAFFASRLLAPQRAAPLLLAPDLAELHREAWSQAAGVGHARLEMLARFFVDHERVLDERQGSAPVPVWFEEIAESDGALLEIATHYVGRALGEGIYQAYSSSAMTSAEIKRLFGADFAAPDSAAQCYRDWVRKLRGISALSFSLPTPSSLA
jgi:hypothetical protein